MNTSNNIETLLQSTGDMALKRRARKIVENIDPKPKDKIVDIGCGDGYYLHLLSHLQVQNLELVGTDFDPKGLEKAKKNLDKDIKIFQGDLMDKLPFKSEIFDKAVMSEVAEHLPDDVRGVAEVARILKPGGILCLTVPHANYPILWDPINWLLEHVLGIHIKSGFFAGIWNQHIRLYTLDQAREMVEKAGMRVEKVESLTFWSLPFNHYLVNLVARYLHNQYSAGKRNESLNKFTTHPNQSVFIKFAFNIVNHLDKLNDLWQLPNTGVALFVKAVKP